MDDDYGLFMAVGFTIFGIFVMCSFLCISCAVFFRKRAARATYSTPVVITGQTYQPPGQPAYPVNLQTTHQVEMTHQPVMPMPSCPPQPIPSYPPSQMPMPYTNITSQSQQLPYPPQSSSNFQNSLNDDLPPSYHKIDKL